MAKLTFRVTEVNDLSNDGVSNKRVVLLAKAAGQYDGTGLDRHDRKPFNPKATIEGRLELLVDNDTQAVHFPIGAVHVMQFPLMPIEPIKAGKPAKPETAKASKADAKAAKSAAAIQ